MHRPASVGAVALVLLFPIAAMAQEWLPRPVRDGLVTQLAERLGAVSEPGDPKAWVDQAGQVVDAVRAQLDDWAVEGTLQRAPIFAGLSFPKHENRYLDAMARYQLCATPMFLQYERSTEARLRRGSAMRLTATTLAVLRLRQPFAEGGGHNQAIEAHLTGAAMERVFEGVQSQPALMEAVNGECDPLVDALFDRLP